MKRVSVLFLFVTSTLIGMRSANAIDGRLKAYAESPQWRRLLHMGGTVARSKSRIEPGSGFFISNAGPRSPLSELEATIAAFENPESYLKKGRGHPYCLFPARVKILERDLTIKIDKSVECPNLDAWNRQLDVKEIAIVYASQFVSNPASAMGHTLLKIVGKNRDDYLNVALGYAADIDEKVGGFAYMWKGLFGGFDGIFSYSPYYEKVHEYNDMEKRDLWEFTLDLDSARQRLLLDHLWELMSNADIDYFFLDENCSYLTLAALEVVFPERDFLTEFPVYLIPLESVKVLDAQGLVSSTTFRPSIQRKLKHKYGLLASDQKKALLQSIEQNSNSELTDPLSLETLLDYISVQRQTGQGTLPEELVKLELETFTKRSLAGQYSHPAIPTPDSPLRSSGTYHLELGAGENRANRNFIHLTFRPGVRQAMDVDTGYLPNSAFNFLQFELKHYGKNSRTELSRITFVEVANASRYTEIDRVFSWRLLLDYNEDVGSVCDTCHFGRFKPSFGFTGALSESSPLEFAVLATTEYQVGPDLKLGHRFWPGLTAEANLALSNRFKFVQNETYSVEVLESDNLKKLTSTTALRFYGIARNVDLGFEFDHSTYFGRRPDFSTLEFKSVFAF